MLMQHMMAFLYQIARKQKVDRKFIYEEFFQSPIVSQFMDREGIAPATLEASRRRCPFLLNLLSAAGVIELRSSDIQILDLVLFPALVHSPDDEGIETATNRLRDLRRAWPHNTHLIGNHDLSILRELFGKTFLTDEYMFNEITILEEL